MQFAIRYVGLDVHQHSIAVAVADGSGGEAAWVGTLPNDVAAVSNCLRQLGAAATLQVCYEAGPTGYDLARRLNQAGVSCTVVAPSLVPQGGRRLKTDRRDAVKLAHFLRAGSLVAVHVPDPRTEARLIPVAGHGGDVCRREVGAAAFDAYLVKSAAPATLIPLLRPRVP
jgi:transposase